MWSASGCAGDLAKVGQLMAYMNPTAASPSSSAISRTSELMMTKSRLENRVAHFDLQPPRVRSRQPMQERELLVGDQ